MNIIETKKNIAIIGANEFQAPLIIKAKELGFRTFVFAWECGDIGEKIADVFVPISIIEKERIWEYCKTHNITACVSIGSDLATKTVNFIQRKLGRPCNPEITDLIATNKYEMRKAFFANGVICPHFLKTNTIPSENELSLFQYPLIVKPTDRSGSRGIFKVNSYSELKSVVRYSSQLSFDKEAIVEEFISGDEYSCESISFNGVHSILQFTKKITTGAPHFIEVGHIEPSDLPKCFLKKIKEQIKFALDTLQIKYGASHTEFKIDTNGNVHIIEIGARMGGDNIGSDLVYYSTGVDYLENVIRVALAQKPDLTIKVEPKAVCTRFIFSEEDLKELERIQKTSKFIRLVSLKVENIGKITDSSTRAGSYVYYL